MRLEGPDTLIVETGGGGSVSITWDDPGHPDSEQQVTLAADQAAWLFRYAGPSVLLAIGARPETRGPR